MSITFFNFFPHTLQAVLRIGLVLRYLALGRGRTLRVDTSLKAFWDIYVALYQVATVQRDASDANWYLFCRHVPDCTALQRVMTN